MVKTNPDIIDEHCIRNDDCIPAVIDENMKLDSKSYHEKLFNTVFGWDDSSSSRSNTVGKIACLGDKGMARKIISKMNNGKIVELSSNISEIVTTAGEVEVDMHCGLRGNLPMLSIYTFCCPNVFLGVRKEWSISF